MSFYDNALLVGTGADERDAEACQPVATSNTNTMWMYYIDF